MKTSLQAIRLRNQASILTGNRDFLFSMVSGLALRAHSHSSLEDIEESPGV
jgi:hypothetical protein